MKAYFKIPALQCCWKEYGLLRHANALLSFNPRRWCTNEDDETKSDVESTTLKRLNWENLALFGPLLRADNKMKTDLFSTGRVSEQYEYVPIQKRNPVTKEPYLIDAVLTFPLCNSWRSAPGSECPNVLLTSENESAKAQRDLPSVSRILSKTMPKESRETLEKWQKMMIDKLGEEGFRKHMDIILAQGKTLHASVAEYFKGTPFDKVQVHPENLGHWKSLKNVLPKISDAIILESWVSHPFLNYRGIIDCVAKYRDEIVVIDWKSSKKIKSRIEYMYDAPLQVAAYMGALNYDQHYKIQVNKGMLVVAYENGEPAHSFFMDRDVSVDYWKKWLIRLFEFEGLSSHEHQGN